MKREASNMVTPAAPASGWRIRRYPVTPRMMAFSRYRKNPCQLKAQTEFTSHNTPLIARTQPNARIEKVVAVCDLTTHTAPRTVNRMPNARNQPQDFLTCSRPATIKSETVVIAFLLLRTATYCVPFVGSTV